MTGDETVNEPRSSISMYSLSNRQIRQYQEQKQCLQLVFPESYTSLS